MGRCCHLLFCFITSPGRVREGRKGFTACQNFWDRDILQFPVRWWEYERDGSTTFVPFDFKCGAMESHVPTTAHRKSNSYPVPVSRNSCNWGYVVDSYWLQDSVHYVPESPGFTLAVKFYPKLHIFALSDDSKVRGYMQGSYPVNSVPTLVYSARLIAMSFSELDYPVIYYSRFRWN